MKVTLIGTPDLDTIKAAAQVCRNSDDPERAMNNALNEGHINLLEHVIFNFKVTGVSRTLTHQLVRHRVASYAQESQRHCVIDVNSIEWYIAPKSAIPLFHSAMQVAGSSYLECIDKGMPPEDARYLLPGGTMTKIVFTMNARSLLNFFNLRCCMHAQWEIRDMADEMLIICRKYLPYFTKQIPNCCSCPNPC